MEEMHLNQQAKDLGEQIKKEKQEEQNKRDNEQRNIGDVKDDENERVETEQCEEVAALSRGVEVMSID